MGLGIPLAMLGLLGVVVPLWLHRVRRRLLREQPLPTLALLSRAAVRRRRTLTFRDKPTLYARLLLISLAALALARPFLSQVASYASESPVAIAIVIDDSMSMARRSRRLGTLFDAAISRARGVLSELAPDSEVSIVLAGSAPRLIAPRTSDLRLARTVLEGLVRRGARGTALESALAMATRELTATKLQAREVLVLSDCAEHANASALEAPSLSMRVECLETKSNEQNAWIREATLTRTGDASESSELRVTLEATENLPELDLQVLLEGRVLDATRVRFSKGVSRYVRTLNARELGDSRSLTVRIDHSDAIAEDNLRELSLKRDQGLSVLLVDGAPALNQRDDELRFAALALSLGEPNHPAPRVTRIDVDGLASEDLSLYDVIVLGNVAAPEDALAERLRQRVEQGAGLLVTAGDRVDPFAYRGPMAKLLPTVIRSRAHAEPARAVAQDGAGSHDLLPDGAVGLETGQTTERLLVEAPGAPNATLLAFDDGLPLLIAGRLGRGQVALLTTTIDDDWTTLPLTPGFVPFLHGIVRGLATVDAFPAEPQAAGTVLEARMPLGLRKLDVVTPDGRRLPLPLDRPRVRIEDTAVVGVYRTVAAFDGRGEREIGQLSFAIMADPRDSVLTPAPVPARAAHRGVQGVSRPKGIDPWIWLLFGIAAIAESLLRLRAKPELGAPARA